MSLGGHGGDLAAQPCPDPRDRRLGAAFQLGPHRQRPPRLWRACATSPSASCVSTATATSPPPCVRTPATPPDPSSSSASQPHEPTFPHLADALRGTTSGAAMASPWLSLYPFAVPARRPRRRSAAYSWRCCRGRAGHLPGRPGDGERRKRSVAALSTFGRGQARRPRAAGHGGVPVVVNPRAWRSPGPAAPDGGSCR